MRAYLGEIDRSVGTALLAGIATGVGWLAWSGLGLILAGVLIPTGAILLAIKHRWLEFGAFLFGTGIVPAVGYRIFGPPPLVASTGTGAIPVELFAPAAADLLTLAGLIALAATAFVGVRESQRRGAHEARHAERKRQRLSDHPS